MEVQGIMSPRIWRPLIIWVALILCAFWGLVELRDLHLLSAKAFKFSGISLAIITWLGGTTIVRFFIEYKVVTPEV